MSNPFEQATRAALEEILLSHLQASKFGYVLTEDGKDALVDDLFSFLRTSRNLKDAGDNMLRRGAVRSPDASAREKSR